MLDRRGRVPLVHQTTYRLRWWPLSSEDPVEAARREFDEETD